MYVSQLLYSTLPSTNYSMANDIIGQIKNLLLSTGLVSVISDNNPSPSQKRKVIFKVGISNHYIEIYVYDTRFIDVTIRNLANTEKTYFLFEEEISSINNTYADLIYGNNNLVIIFNNNTNTSICYLKTSSSDALVGKCSPSYNDFFSNVGDDAFKLVYPQIGYKTTTGKWIFLPVFVAKKSINQIDESLQPVAYSVSNVNLTPGRIYRDESGRYYACVPSGVLIPDV